MGEGELNVTRLGGQRSTHVLMLHGWGQSAENLQPLGELLAEKAAVHLINLPGFGGSVSPPAVWGTEDYAKRILEYLDEQKINQAVLLGHSFGGKVSLRFCARYPERVSQLVLIASSGLRPYRPFKKKLRFFGIRMLRGVLRFAEKYFSLGVYRSWFIPKFASPDYQNAGELRQTFVRIVNEDLSAYAARITVPALLLWGAEDTETPVETARRLHGLLRNSKLIVLPGRGHYPFVDSGLHLCAHYIRAFLEGPLTSASPREASHA